MPEGQNLKTLLSLAAGANPAVGQILRPLLSTKAQRRSEDLDRLFRTQQRRNEQILARLERGEITAAEARTEIQKASSEAMKAAFKRRTPEQIQRAEALRNVAEESLEQVIAGAGVETGRVVPLINRGGP